MPPELCVKPFSAVVLVAMVVGFRLVGLLLTSIRQPNGSRPT